MTGDGQDSQLVYRLLLRAEPGEIPPHIRLRHLLKLALRVCGMRCLGYELCPPPQAPPIDRTLTRIGDDDA